MWKQDAGRPSSPRIPLRFTYGSILARNHTPAKLMVAPRPSPLYTGVAGDEGSGISDDSDMMILVSILMISDDDNGK